jgi:hypothetical protein
VIVPRGEVGRTESETHTKRTTNAKHGDVPKTTGGRQSPSPSQKPRDSRLSSSGISLVVLNGGICAVTVLTLGAIGFWLFGLTGDVAALSEADKSVVDNDDTSPQASVMADPVTSNINQSPTLAASSFRTGGTGDISDVIPPATPETHSVGTKANGPAFAPKAARTEINRAVVDYARSVVGQHVGNGQCTELAIAALQVAGAQANHGYVWGRRLSGYRDLQPGDIIQMQKATFRYANGRTSWSDGPHTAIVTGVEGTMIRVLEQNISGGPVQTGQYDLSYMTGGTMAYYVPIAGGNRDVGFEQPRRRMIP